MFKGQIQITIDTETQDDIEAIADAVATHLNTLNINSTVHAVTVVDETGTEV